MAGWIALGVALWLFGSALVGDASASRGYSRARGFFVSVFFSPLFGILYIAALPRAGKEP